MNLPQHGTAAEYIRDLEIANSELRVHLANSDEHVFQAKTKLAMVLRAVEHVILSGGKMDDVLEFITKTREDI